MAAIGEIIESLGLVTKNITILYKKIDSLTERVKKLEIELFGEEPCMLCGGRGQIMPATGEIIYYTCPLCNGSGTIKIKED